MVEARSWGIVALLACVAACGDGSASAPDAAVACESADDCDDGEGCTVDRCHDGTCEHVPDDAAVPPDDGATCTTDRCEDGVAVHTADHEACDVIAASCVAERCDPENQTTNDGSGCAAVPDHASCDDDNVCTDDLCDAEAGSADPATGCARSDNTVELVQIPGNCQREACSGGVPSSANDPTDVPATDTDGFSCTVPACSATSPSAPIEAPSAALCDDDLGCTVDACDPDASGDATGCTAAPDDGVCSAVQACDVDQDPLVNATGCVSADTCPALFAIAHGEVISGTTTGFANDVQPSCATPAVGHPDRAFALSLAVDSDVSIVVSPSDGHLVSIAVLEVVGAACGRELLCAAPAAGLAQVEALNLAAGTYAIVVDGTGPTSSAGTFTVSATVAPTTIGEGALVINEMLANPGFLLDNNAEFFEIANPSTRFAIGTIGLTLVEADGTPSTQTLLGPAAEQLVVAPSGFLLGVASDEPALNGGLVRDFDLEHALNNTPNEDFEIRKSAVLLDHVDLATGGFPAASDGSSCQLDVSKKSFDLNDAFTPHWCLTPTNVYANNNKGTPGAENESCAAPTCTVPTQATDCNDNNACTDDVCVGGSCQNANDNGNVPTPDGFSCTTESCLNGSTVITASNAACDDAVACTTDTCVGVTGEPGTGCAHTGCEP